MAKVYDSYYKSEDGNAKIRDAEQKAREQVEELNKQGQSLVDEYKELVEQSKNTVLTPEARSKAQDEAQKKLEDIQRKQNDVQTFSANTQRSLQQRMKIQRDLLLEEITKVVNDIAKQKGATLVIDKSGPTLFGIPTVLYSDPAYDITDEVVKEVNKDRPPTAGGHAGSRHHRLRRPRPRARDARPTCRQPRPRPRSLKEILPSPVPPNRAFLCPCRSPTAPPKSPPWSAPTRVAGTRTRKKSATSPRSPRRGRAICPSSATPNTRLAGARPRGPRPFCCRWITPASPAAGQVFIFRGKSVRGPRPVLCARIEQSLWPKPAPGIHPSAVVGHGAQVDPSATVGPLVRRGRGRVDRRRGRVAGIGFCRP